MTSRKAGYAALQLHSPWDVGFVVRQLDDVDVTGSGSVSKDSAGPVLAGLQRQHPWDDLGVHRSEWRRLNPVYVMWWYALPLLKTHLQSRFDFEHLWDLPAGSSADELLRVYSDAQRRRPDDTMAQLLFQLFGRRWLKAAFVYLFWWICVGLQPWLMGSFTDYLAARPESALPGLAYSFGLCACGVGYTLTIQHKFTLLHHNATDLRTLLMMLLYRKSLRLAIAQESFGDGDATNIMSNDVEKLCDSTLWLHYLWIAPTGITLIIGYMCFQLGVAAVFGSLLVMAMVPMQAAMSRRLAYAKREMVSHTDRRTDLVSQMLKGIEVVKVYVWEPPFAARLEGLREKELCALQRALYWRAIMRASTYVMPSVVTFVTLTTFRLMGGQLTLAIVMMTMTFITAIRFPLMIMPNAIALASEGLVALQRIEGFLQLPEAPASALRRKCCPVNSAQQPEKGRGEARSNGVLLEGALFSWTTLVESSNYQPSLQVAARILAPQKAVAANATQSIESPAFDVGPLSLDLPAGGIVGVVGPVGCGKSTFIMGLLGELQNQHQQLHGRPIKDKEGAACGGDAPIGYLSQTPAIVNGSLRQNVTLGMAYDAKRYATAVEDACLGQDIAGMPAGDMTEIGERGTTVSGGQKARIGFARLLYQQQAINILDDPYSAVDPDVALDMHRRGFEGTLAGTTRVLVVSARLELLATATVVIRLGTDGDVEAYGPPSEVLHGYVVPNNGRKPQGEVLESSAGGIDAETVIDSTDAEEKEADAAGRFLTTAEDRAAGTVAKHIYSTYFSYAVAGRGGLVIFSIVAAYSTGQVARVGVDVWLSAWATASESAAQGDEEQMDTFWWVAVAAVLVLANFLVAFGRALLCVSLSIRASTALHKGAVEALLKAPLLYFQQNPLGRILNRFSSDLMKADQELPDMLFMYLDSLFLVISAGIFCVYSMPYLVVALCPALVLCLKVQKLYRATSRELLRLMGISRSPIFALFSRTLRIRDTLRAFAAQRGFEEEATALVERNSAIYLTRMLIGFWTQNSLNLVAVGLGLLLDIAATLLRHELDPAIVALAVVYSLQMMSLMAQTVRNYADVENNMTSVERLTHFMQIETEGTSHQAQPPEGWPSDGRIEFDSVELRYRTSLPQALRKLTLRVPARSKVGLVGRTGAGKSSVMAALFRLFELEGGSIRVDGIDTRTVDLPQLRAAFSVIPQSPVLFSGSVRTNVDPNGEYQDEAIWIALRKARLEDKVRGLPGQLEYPVTEDGGNLSQGQCQLICIARALLVDRTILLCDEATSSVDSATDGAIQDILRSQFIDRTVLTIAHRLQTIAHCDLVAVLDQGKCVEHGAPLELIDRKPQSRFAAMCGVEVAEIRHLAAAQ